MTLLHRDAVNLVDTGRRRSNHPGVDLSWLAPEPWTEHALCASTDPEAFFPEQGGSTREAKAVCMRCPVRADCLLYALANQERFGVWGGLSERERRKLTKQQAAA